MQNRHERRLFLECEIGMPFVGNSTPRRAKFEDFRRQVAIVTQVGMPFQMAEVTTKLDVGTGCGCLVG